MMNKRIVSPLLLLLTTELVSAGNRPGSAGGCDGVGPVGLGPRGPPPGRPMGPPNRVRRRFLKEIAIPARKRSLQDGESSPEELELCCSGNGDFDFLMRDLDIKGKAVATEAEGFRSIPGSSRWTCRKACRDPANGYDLASCYEACDCVQNCPESTDFLTNQCRSKCFPLDGVEKEICIEDCDQQCGERCTGTFNNYVLPLDIYREGLEILDCYFGDLIGDATASCSSGQAFWQSVGMTCQVTEGENFDCECDEAGTCLSVVYPCNYAQYCTTPVAFVPSSGKGKGKGKGSSSRRYRR